MNDLLKFRETLSLEVTSEESASFWLAL